MDENFLKIKEAAELAQVSTVTMINWCGIYEGLGKKIGGRWRVSSTALTKFLEGQNAGKKD